MALKLWSTEADLPSHWRPIPVRGAADEQALIDACTKLANRRMMIVDDNQRQDRGR